MFWVRLNLIVMVNFMPRVHPGIAFGLYLKYIADSENPHHDLNALKMAQQ